VPELAQFDFAGIGSGPGGYVTVVRAAQLAFKTAIVEKDDKFGATCLRRRYIPTKLFLFDAEVYNHFKNAGEFGTHCKHFALDWGAIHVRQFKIVAKLAKGAEFLPNKIRLKQSTVTADWPATAALE
jgi:dihydrolipoyl dehydrogenase